ncbi:MAG TPA: ATP synthase subunit I [Alloacidobacterium sp.]|nr:ATP synthase subunit I [Alloacidobacterium sp.]
MTESGHPIFDFTDADLKIALRRAFKVTVILGLILAVVLTVVYGWQTGALLLAGALISATGLWEWQRLVAFINARLDNQRAAGGAARVVTMFSLRLLLAGGVLYVSLKCFHGSVYALLAGLGLAVFALTIEAVRLIRS